MAGRKRDPVILAECAQHMWEARVTRGMSRAELAKSAGVGVRTLEYYEAGETEPGITKLIQLANAMGISIDEYIGHKTVGKECAQ